MSRYEDMNDDINNANIIINIFINSRHIFFPVYAKCIFHG